MKVTEGQVSEALTGSSSIRVKAIKTKDLTPEVRGIYHLVQHTILPRSGSTDTLIGLDYMLLYCLVKKLKINLPRLIMDHMASTVSKERKSHAALPYGMLLTRVFKHIGFPLESEVKKEKGKIFTMATFRNLLTEKQEKKAGIQISSSFTPVDGRVLQAPAEATRKRKVILPESSPGEDSSSSSESTPAKGESKAKALVIGRTRGQKKRKEKQEEEEEKEDDTIIPLKRRGKLPIRRKTPSPPPQPKHQQLSASVKLAEELFGLKDKSSSSEESASGSEAERIEEAVRQSLHQKALEEQELQRLREIARGAQSSGVEIEISEASASPSLQQILPLTETAHIGPEEVQASQTIAEIAKQARLEAEKLMAAEQQAKSEAEAFAAVIARARDETDQAQLAANQSDDDHTATTHSEDEIQEHIAGLKSVMLYQQPDECKGLLLEPESETALSDTQIQPQPEEAVGISALVLYQHQPQPLPPPETHPQPQQQPPSTYTPSSTQILISTSLPQTTFPSPHTSPPQPSAIPTSAPPPTMPAPPATTSSAHSPAEFQLLLQNIHDLASRMDRVEASNRDLAAHLRAQDQLMLQMMQMLRDMQNRGQ